MAREQANISTGLWGDRDWRLLPQAAKYLYLLLLTHPTITYAGTVDWRTSKLAMLSPDTSAEDIQESANALQEARFIFVDEESEEVLIRSYLRHDGILKQPKLSVSMANAYAAVSSMRIQDIIAYELHRLHEEYPEWAAWRSEKVQDILKNEGQDMGAFTLNCAQDLPLAEASVRAEPRAAFTLNGAQAQGLHTATATATATSSKEDPAPHREADAGPTAADEFEQWYRAYPKKKDKGHARTAFKAARKKTSLETLLEATKAYANEVKMSDPKFIAYPATWLNGERWHDEQQQSRIVSGPWTKEFHQ